MPTATKERTTVTVRQVTTKRDLRRFVDYPNRLYRDVPQFVPAMYGDDVADWDPKKNPAFDYCEARCWLAYRDGEIVGRIGAILSHRANEKWGTARMRFSQVDFIDDEAVSAALFAAVEDWAAEKGCTQVHGPLGFTDMDREGMLVDGFDRRSMFITYYNHPYYLRHLERLGYRKDTDWIEYKVAVPTLDSEVTQKLHRIAQRVLQRKNLHVAQVRNRLGFRPLVPLVFRLVNEAYAPLYGTVNLSDRQIQRYADKFIPLIDPRYTCFVLNEQEELVAFGITAPSMASAMQQCRGRLLPSGWVYVLRNLMKNNALDMFLVAVKPELQGTGINAILMDHLIKGANNGGIRYAETGPMLETNDKIQAQWKLFDKSLHKRRRCFIKDLD